MSVWKLTVLLFVAAILVSAAAPAQTVEYYHLDAIGNVRAVTNQVGSVIERHDYLPYGEECTTGTCATNPGAGAGQPRKFTSKERDAETGLDYFGARSYGSKIGRFTTVDPVYTWQDNLVDPQRWNRYAYARSNPLRYVDPDGKVIETAWDVVSLGMSVKAVRDDPSSVMNWLSLGADVVSVVGPGIPAIGMAIRGAGKVDDAMDLATVGQLRKAGQADAHHVIQDAAVRDLPGYNTNAAPGIRLEGPARVSGTPHHTATQVQRQGGGGTYGAERRIGYKALRKAGQSRKNARSAIERADDYFESIGVTRDTLTRTPGNRRQPE